MSKVIERNKMYLVKSEHGSYSFNNRKTAEKLNKQLTQYETITQQHQQTQQPLHKVQKQIIQLQMTCNILTAELQKLHEDIL